ncbi:hypothetical protein CDAR_41071 [Caerostris darwini]|uniref:Uncharacterized protein n=1 Tax=Caerostris darwini TaxID=1538125 RepID=A0AAV4W1W5_9ARAC|nr:hypothetical protein CDAR_41071 [Caerostris darwini]
MITLGDAQYDMYSIIFMHLLIYTICFGTSYAKTTSENLPEISEKESLETRDSNTKNDFSSNNLNIAFNSTSIADSVPESIGAHQGHRKKRDTLSKSDVLLNEKKHVGKRSVLVFKQQTLEIQVPDDTTMATFRQHHARGGKMHHHRNSLQNKNKIQHDSKENINIKIEKSSKKDFLGNQLHKINSKAKISQVESINPHSKAKIPHGHSSNDRPQHMNSPYHGNFNQDYPDNEEKVEIIKCSIPNMVAWKI